MLVTGSLPAQGTGAQRGGLPSPNAPREDWQRVADIFTALGAREGSRIADVGAGDGWLTTRLAKHVGSSGRVFAVDNFEPALMGLRRTLAAQTPGNVEVIRGDDDDPHLPQRSLDGIVVVNAYHEMSMHALMLAAFVRALAPGGKLVIVEGAPHDGTASREMQTAAHQLGIEYAERELLAAGFEIVRRDPAFTIHTVQGMRLPTQTEWLLVARVAGTDSRSLPSPSCCPNATRDSRSEAHQSVQDRSRVRDVARREPFP